MNMRSAIRHAAVFGLLAAFGCDTNVNDGTVPTFEVLMLSRSSEGVAADNQALLASSSHDGSRVAFMSPAGNLDPLDRNNADDIFVRDTETHTTLLASIDITGTASGNNSSSYPRISPDGRFVAFLSTASDLTPPGFDNNNCFDVFVRDLEENVTVPVSVIPAGTATAIIGVSLFGGEEYTPPAILSDDTYVYVAFTSRTPDLVVPIPSLFRKHVYLRRIPLATFSDTTTGTTLLVSQESAVEADSESHEPSIGMDGSSIYYAWSSSATNLAAPDSSATQDIFWKAIDKTTLGQGATQLVSIETGGAAGGNGGSSLPSISANGRYVAFESSATNLLATSDLNGVIDIFVRGDIIAGSPSTQIVSVSMNGEQATEEARVPSISADGRFVAFDSLSANLTPGDTNGYSNLFIWDRDAGTLLREPLTFFGGEANQGSHFASIAGDGESVSFHSWATNLLPGVETNYVGQVFQRRFSP